MKVLLTGCSGFVGSAVSELLSRRGDTVVGFGRVAPRSHCLTSHITGDLATGNGLENVPWKEIEMVIHLAAAGVKASQRFWWDTIQTNILGTERLLNFISRYASQNPILVAARTCYEDELANHSSLRANPYIVTKAAGNDLIRLWAKQYVGKTVFVRLFSVYGPNDDPNNVLTYAARSLKHGTPCIFGTAKGRRDWIYIDDAASGIIAASNTNISELCEFDIGTGKLTVLRDIIDAMISVVEPLPASVIFDPAKETYDLGLAMRSERPPPGWHPETSILSGIRKLLA